jgi:hypothetical protein
MWSDLRRREDELKWSGNLAGFREPYGSMGRITDASAPFDAAWAREQIGRVDRVRQALRESGPQAQRIIARQLSGIDLSSVWPTLISACQDIALLYGGSVVAGAVIGGAGGAFVGGVGAVPGAAAGAAAGSYLGGWVLGLLGLKSLVDGVTEAVPQALKFYERGFSEAWGPTRHEHVHPAICTTGCNPSFAATDLANGHVILVSAILTALVAYLTRGKGDKGALLKEVGHSPRLGPKVAQWIDQNEDRLRRHPALQSRAGGASGSRASPREQPPQLKRRREPARSPEPQRPPGMPQKVVPCFKTKGLPQGNVPEFDRQLKGQESGINSMTVEEYIKGRDAFDAKDVVRNPTLARQERAAYQQDLERDLAREYQANGLSIREAEKRATYDAIEKMKLLAALHTPDMVAGGKDVIGDFGNRNINSRIGAQWKRGGRLTDLDKAANAVPASIRGTTKMNVKLERCK